jgi:hypothetical protein
MSPLCNRRDVLQLLGLSGAGGVLRAQDSAPSSRPSREELVARLRSAPTDQALALGVQWLRSGVREEDLLGAALLASAHDINPVPVGFALHALMVVSSAHEVLRQVPAERRALPALFCVHDFKQSQARSRARSEWVLPPRKRLEGGDPERALAEAFRTCDKDLADDAITALHGTRAIDDVFELLWRRGAWPLDNLGHRAILVAQAQRALLHVGADAAEPVLRTVARSLAHTARDADLASGKASERLAVAAPGAFSAPPDPERSRRWLAALRDLDEQKAPAECARLLAEAAAPATLWDGIRLRAFELMMQHPGIAGLHAVTTVNALHEAARRTSLDGTRTFALLQAAAWCARFQKALGAPPADALGAIDELAPAGEAPRAADLLALAAKDRAAARAGALALDADGQRAFAVAARDCLVRKASEAHAYKFTSAALEEVGKAHPAHRPRLLAASLTDLRHEGDPDGPSWAAFQG